MDAVDLNLMKTPAAVEKAGGGPAAGAHAGLFGALLANVTGATASIAGAQVPALPGMAQPPATALAHGGGALQVSFQMTPELQAAIQSANAQTANGQAANGQAAAAAGAHPAGGQPGDAAKTKSMPFFALARTPDLNAAQLAQPVTDDAKAPVPPGILAQLGALSAANENGAPKSDDGVSQQVQDFLATLMANGVAVTPVQLPAQPKQEAQAGDTVKTPPLPAQAKQGQLQPPLPDMAAPSAANPAQPQNNAKAAQDFAALLQPSSTAELTPAARQAVEQLTRAARRGGNAETAGAGRSASEAGKQTGDGKAAAIAATATTHPQETAKQSVVQASPAPAAHVGDFAAVAVTPVSALGDPAGQTPQGGLTIAGQPAAAAQGDAAQSPAAPRHAYAPPADQLAVQVGRALQSGKNQFQIQLNPTELGRVSVKLDVRDDGSVTMMVAAANADTLDMLKRDQHGLEKAMQDAGFKTPEGSLSFSLQGGEGQQRQQALWNEAQNGGQGKHQSGADTFMGSDGDAILTDTQNIRLSSHAGALDIQA